jgi:hypothetical protein
MKISPIVPGSEVLVQQFQGREPALGLLHIENEFQFQISRIVFAGWERQSAASQSRVISITW